MSSIDSLAREAPQQRNSFIEETAGFIHKTQRADGGIPWSEDGHLDPWNHVESAMALSIGGQYEAATQAYQWLRDAQLDNGGWWARYQHGSDDRHMETNFIAYAATGIWHHYSITLDRNFLDFFWPMVRAALDCVVACQHANGTIGWEIDAHAQVAETALLTGCASIHRSLDCGILIARELGYDQPQWVEARDCLAPCLRASDTCFLNKSRYAMDWFYPLLSGALSKAQMRERVMQSWDDFVVAGLGCRCVLDEPWIAVAESCELVIALQCSGQSSRAKKIYKQLHRFRLSHGEYWVGYQYRLGIPWPRQKTTWTAAAVLLAYDALYAHTPASNLFLLPATAQ